MGAFQQRMPECAQNDEEQTEKYRPDFNIIGPRWSKRAAEILAQSEPSTAPVSGMRAQGDEPAETVNRLTLELFVDLFEGLQSEQRRG